LERVKAAGNGAPIIPDVDARELPFPLSDLQRAYIFGRNPTLPLGGIGCDVYLELERENLDPKRIELGVNKLIARYEVLRMVIDTDETQRILAHPPWFKVPVTDLTVVGPEESEAALAAIRERMCHQVHDVRSWPLYDIRVATLSGGRA